MSESLKFKMPRLATIEETVSFLNESAKEANVKNCLTAYRLRQLALSNEIVHIRAGKKILINIDKLIEFLNNGKIYKYEENSDSKYKTIKRINI